MTYTIMALAANKSGVLTRVSGLFARRGYNIHSISACSTEDENFSRITIELDGDEYMLTQMVKQLDKLIDIKKITYADEKSCIFRELCLVKVKASPEKRSEIIEIKEVYKAKVVDLSPESMILEITGEPNQDRRLYPRDRALRHHGNGAHGRDRIEPRRRVHQRSERL